MHSNEKNKWPTLDIGIYSRPYFGERVNGDWAFVSQEEALLFIGIIDGTGHGPKAKKVVTIVKEILREQWSSDLDSTMQRLHKNLNSTLGAAVGISVLNLETLQLKYSGVGNTVFRKLGQNPERLISVEGVVGIRMRNPSNQRVQVNKGDILLFYTDGVKENFDINAIPNINTHSATFAAKKIVQTFGSQYDDSTCIVIKVNHAN
jgi:serine phosphatase RsbU (regulator of sigma subunit)